MATKCEEITSRLIQTLHERGGLGKRKGVTFEGKRDIIKGRVHKFCAGRQHKLHLRRIADAQAEEVGQTFGGDGETRAMIAIAYSKTTTPAREYVHGSQRKTSFENRRIKKRYSKSAPIKFKAGVRLSRPGTGYLREKCVGVTLISRRMWKGKKGRERTGKARSDKVMKGPEDARPRSESLATPEGKKHNL